MKKGLGYQLVALILGGSVGIAGWAWAADTAGTSQASADAAPAKASGSFSGFIRSELAYTYASPTHWSEGLVQAQLGRQGSLSENVKYKVTGRFSYDAAYDFGNFYPPDVKADQRREFQFRETYIDATAGDWEFRLGRQHIIWGEMPGLFFADVVSARDLRQFLLPDFDILRIPQWAARAEYFKDDFHGEVIWIPYATFDNIGKPGAEFYPFPAGLRATLPVLADETPSRTLANSNYGIRLGTKKNGWDVSGFVYRSFDVNPVFALDQTLNAYRLQHDRITQTGGTLTKDFGPAVLRAEAVYTRGRRYPTSDPAAPTGLISQDALLYVAGLDFTLPANVNVNLQVFDNVIFDRDPNLLISKHEAGTTLLLRRNFGAKVEARALFMRSLNRDDWQFSPEVRWALDKNWRLTVGADIFDGATPGYFGRFRNRDRAFTEVRYSF